MKKIILTPKEMEKHNELFEYEMTQVILALKEKYENPDMANSPLREIELTDKDVNKRVDYIPMQMTEPEIQPQDIPNVQIEAKLMPTDKIKVDIAPQTIPDSAIAIKFKPVQPGFDDFSTADVPAVSKIQKISPLNVPKVPIVPAREVPSTAVSVGFSPGEFEQPPLVPPTVPNIADIKPYIPLSLSLDKISTGEAPQMDVAITAAPFELNNIITATEMPNIGQKVKFDPITPPALNSAEVSVPEMKSEVSYDFYGMQHIDLAEVPVPKMKSDISYELYDAPHIDLSEMPVPKISSDVSYELHEIQHIDLAEVSVPSVKKSFGFEPVSPRNEPPNKINIPALKGVPEFTAVKTTPIEKLQNPLPKHAIDIKPINMTKTAPPDLSAEMAQAAENAAPRDFYAMWLDM